MHGWLTASIRRVAHAALQLQHGTQSSARAVGAHGWWRQQQQLMHHHCQQLQQHTRCLHRQLCSCPPNSNLGSVGRQQPTLQRTFCVAPAAAAGKAAPASRSKSSRTRQAKTPPAEKQPVGTAAAAAAPTAAPAAAAPAAAASASQHQHQQHHHGSRHTPRFGGLPRPPLRTGAGVARTQVRPVEQVLRAPQPRPPPPPPAAAAPAPAAAPAVQPHAPVPEALAVSVLAIVSEVKEDPDWGDFKIIKCKTVLQCSNSSDSKVWVPADEGAAIQALQDTTSSSSSSSSRRTTSGSDRRDRPSLFQQRAARMKLSVSGTLPGVRVGRAYAITGRWQHDPTWGWSIRADSCEERMEDSDPLVLLQQLPDVGFARATVLVQAFGPSMRAIMDRLSGPKQATVAALAKLPRFTPALAKSVKAAWDETEGTRQVQLKLQAMGLPQPLAQRLASSTSHGKDKDVAAWLTESPWEPYFSQFPGFTLQVSEVVAAAVGFSPGAAERGAAHLLEALVAAAKGGQKVTGLTWGSLQQAAQQTMARQAQQGLPAWPAQRGLQEAAQLLVRQRRIVAADDVSVAQLPDSVLLVPEGATAAAQPWKAGWWVQLRSLWEDEADVVAFVVAACRASYDALRQLQAQEQAASSSTTSKRRTGPTYRSRRGATSSSSSSSSASRVQLPVAPLPQQLLDGTEPDSSDEEQQQLNEGQRAVLAYSQALPLLVVTGGPGCGKTHVSRHIVRQSLDYGPGQVDRISIAAPTGRAAQRLQDFLPLEEDTTERSSCSTIHRLLKYQGQGPVVRISLSPGMLSPGTAASSSTGDDGSSSRSSKGVKLPTPPVTLAAAGAALDAALDGAADDASGGPDLSVRDRCYFGRDAKLPGGARDDVRYLFDEVSMLDVPLAGPLLAALTDPPPAADSDSYEEDATAPAAATAAGSLRGSVVLVGDVDQLPPVGPGRPIAAALAEGLLPVIDLRCIYRSAAGSAIVAAAHAINQGRLPELTTWDVHPASLRSDLARHITAARGAAGGPLRLPTDALFVRLPEYCNPQNPTWGSQTPDSCVADALCEVVQLLVPDLADSLGLYMQQDVQVLSPRRHGTPIGTQELNVRLQALFNPPSRGKDELPRKYGRVLRQGDRVTHLRNDPSLDVFNGDLGYVESISALREVATVCYPPRVERRDKDSESSSSSDKSHNEGDEDAWLRACAAAAAAERTDDSGAFHRVTYAAEDMDTLALAYAMTVHKAQGGEFPVVLVPMHASIGALLRRALLYSAVSRAKQQLIIVGTQSALSTAVRTATHEQDDFGRLRAKMRVAAQAAGLGTFARAVYGPDGWSHH